MADYDNFYENLEEAVHRLVGTIVKYEDEFYLIDNIQNADDNIFRVHMRTLKNVLTGGKSITKKMNSPYFNKFRPFPLGMVNIGGHAKYLSRTPVRSRLQGLADNSLIETPIDDYEATSPPPVIPVRRGREKNVQWCSQEMEDCFKGDYPSFAETAEALDNAEIANHSVAFSRELALVRGFCGIRFLANKSGIIGQYHGKTNAVLLSPELKYLKESLEETGFFRLVF